MVHITIAARAAVIAEQQRIKAARIDGTATWRDTRAILERYDRIVRRQSRETARRAGLMNSWRAMDAIARRLGA